MEDVGLDKNTIGRLENLPTPQQATQQANIKAEAEELAQTPEAVAQV